MNTMNTMSATLNNDGMFERMECEHALKSECSALDALDYGIYVCNKRAGSIRHAEYKVACSDVILFLEAAKERLLSGGGLYAYAVTQSEPK
jgi:hypothetical protein